jgi:hypothetical protein
MVDNRKGQRYVADLRRRLADRIDAPQAAHFDEQQSGNESGARSREAK